METGAGLERALHAPVVCGSVRVEDLAVWWTDNHEVARLVCADPRARLVGRSGIDIFRFTVYNT